MSKSGKPSTHYDRICAEQRAIPVRRDKIIADCEVAARIYIDWLLKALSWGGSVKFFRESQAHADDEQFDFRQEMISCFEPGKGRSQLKIGVALVWPGGCFLDVLTVETGERVPHPTVEFVENKLRVPDDFSEEHARRVVGKIISQIRSSVLVDHDWGGKKVSNSIPANATAKPLSESRSALQAQRSDNVSQVSSDSQTTNTAARAETSQADAIPTAVESEVRLSDAAAAGAE